MPCWESLDVGFAFQSASSLPKGAAILPYPAWTFLRFKNDVGDRVNFPDGRNMRSQIFRTRMATCGVGNIKEQGPLDFNRNRGAVKVITRSWELASEKLFIGIARVLNTSEGRIIFRR